MAYHVIFATQILQKHASYVVNLRVAERDLLYTGIASYSISIMASLSIACAPSG